MPEKTFGRIVDDYLLNRISPEELKWLRQKIATDEDCKKIFQRKCGQHQVSQYFMVQQAPPGNWDLEKMEEEGHTLHLRKKDTPSIEDLEDEEMSPSLPEDVPPTFRIRDFWDFALLSGLICITVIFLICWMDRTRLFSPETLNSNEQPNVQTSKVRNLKFPPRAYHHVISPTTKPPEEKFDSSNSQWLSVNQLDWYIRNQYPQSTPVDLKRLSELQKSWDFPPDTFPHSILTQNAINP